MSNRKLLITGLIVVVLAALAVAVASRVLAPTVTPAVAQSINPAQYQEQFEGKSHLLIDVRTPEEFAGGYIPGAVNIPLQELSSRLSEVPKDQPIVVYCRSGNRSAQAVDLLTEAGYTGLYDLGGIIDWGAAGLPVEG
jgi:phage shock protein E